MQCQHQEEQNEVLGTDKMFECAAKTLCRHHQHVSLVRLYAPCCQRSMCTQAVPALSIVAGSCSLVMLEKSPLSLIPSSAGE